MIKVFHEADRVILDLCGQRRDVFIPCVHAEHFAQTLEENADRAELELPTIAVNPQSWKCKVESFDGMVVLRFTPPVFTTKSVIPLTIKAARDMAAAVRFKESQARHKMRLVVGA